MPVYDPRGQNVTCARCRREYVCTPEHDYFNATTATDGLCWDCLMAPFEVVDEPPYGKLSAPLKAKVRGG